MLPDRLLTGHISMQIFNKSFFQVQLLRVNNIDCHKYIIGIGSFHRRSLLFSDEGIGVDTEHEREI